MASGQAAPLGATPFGAGPGAGRAAVREQAPAQAPASATPALDEFGHDLTDDAREGRIDPVIGRDEGVEQVVEILAVRRKSNAVLIGEPGVGKTAIVEGLARRVASSDVPDVLRGVRIVALDLAGMVAGAQYRGQFEQRLKAVLAEVEEANGSIVVFVDELHTVLGAGGAEGAMDAANMLKPMLAHRYVTEERLPDKAIDLVDQASARVRLRGGSSPEQLRERVAELEAAKAEAVAAED